MDSGGAHRTRRGPSMHAPARALVSPQGKQIGRGWGVEGRRARMPQVWERLRSRQRKARSDESFGARAPPTKRDPPCCRSDFSRDRTNNRDEGSDGDVPSGRSDASRDRTTKRDVSVGADAPPTGQRAAAFVGATQSRQRKVGSDESLGLAPLPRRQSRPSPLPRDSIQSNPQSKLRLIPIDTPLWILCPFSPQPVVNHEPASE